MDMNNNKVKLVKLFSGDLVIGSAVSNEPSMPSMMDFNIELDNPRQIAIVPTMAGPMKIALGSVCEPFNVKRLKEHISIPKAQVMFVLDEDEIDGQLVNGYKSEVSGIKIASAADTAALNSGSGNAFTPNAMASF